MIDKPKENAAQIRVRKFREAQERLAAARDKSKRKRPAGDGAQ
ncbi:hypothetical protein [Microbacterium galbinum]|nr:hypothetical protein [Microbacterium galbinum]